MTVETLHWGPNYSLAISVNATFQHPPNCPVFSVVHAQCLLVFMIYNIYLCVHVYIYICIHAPPELNFSCKKICCWKTLKNHSETFCEMHLLSTRTSIQRCLLASGELCRMFEVPACN